MGRRRRRRRERAGEGKLEMGTELMVLIFLTCLQLIRGVSGELFDVPALFVFGDSLVDDGNNNYIPSIARANYPPYGIDFGYPTGRFCNGLTVVDYGALALGVPLVPPCLSLKSKGASILRGVNYASAAGGILDETGKNYVARVSFNQQLALFEKAIEFEYSLLFQEPQALSRYLARSIFALVFGSNDYINNYLMPKLYLSSSLYDPDSYAELLVQAYAQQMRKLYSLGARKIIVANIGPLGCIPSQLAMADTDGSCVERINRAVSAFNERLFELVKNINSTLPGSFFVYQDVYGIFSDIAANPQKYGFTVANKACCGVGRYGGALTCLPFEKPCEDRDHHVFWDAFHPTQAVNKIIFESCYAPASTYCYPMGFQSLATI
ncbi:GDSL esterase/lipase 7-like [Nymphaea colorata]|nr:GDSL esterase/lipase 7-like [Nymphaea colorata]